MDTHTLTALAKLIRGQRLASLGTLRAGEPFVSMVVYAVAPELTAFYLHLSRLSVHTKDILADARVSLLINETDRGEPDPQTLGRVTIQGVAVTVPKMGAEYEPLKALYLQKFPEAEMRFSLGDFDLWRIEPQSARYVGGFAQAFNLTLAHFKEAGQVS